MKAIQSFRSESIRPALDCIGGEDLIKLDVISLALSAASIKNHFDKLECITDSAGAKLINELKLPYTNVIDVGDSFASDPAFWVHSKFKAYQSKEPFLHFDNDLFLWEPLSENVLEAPVVAFHGESYKWPFYEDIIEKSEKLPYVFDYPAKYPLNKTALNMAIFGGNDIEAINLYANEVLDIVLNKLNGFDLPHEQKRIAWMAVPMFEQLLASYFFQYKLNKPVKLVVLEKDIFVGQGENVKAITHIGPQKIKIKKDNNAETNFCFKMLEKLKNINSDVFDSVNRFLIKAHNQDLNKLVEAK